MSSHITKGAITFAETRLKAQEERLTYRQKTKRKREINKDRYHARKEDFDAKCQARKLKQKITNQKQQRLDKTPHMTDPKRSWSFVTKTQMQKSNLH